VSNLKHLTWALTSSNCFASSIAQPIQTSAGEIALTISAGVASAVGLSVNFDQLQQEADAALYLAKERGRNRVEARQPEAPLA
jgi:diguanylate cyclase (GGDEF)-like protein